MKQNSNSYIEPEMKIMYFQTEDIITNSTEELPATFSMEETWLLTEGAGF